MQKIMDLLTEADDAETTFLEKKANRDNALLPIIEAYVGKIYNYKIEKVLDTDQGKTLCVDMISEFTFENGETDSRRVCIPMVVIEADDPMEAAVADSNIKKAAVDLERKQREEKADKAKLMELLNKYGPQMFGDTK